MENGIPVLVSSFHDVPGKFGQLLGFRTQSGKIGSPVAGQLPVFFFRSLVQGLDGKVRRWIGNALVDKQGRRKG
ncbi:MAG: hypothetical protein IJS32_07960 [Kiritimatiellae bacterium]|nr:hypothetical protein [Kiritimatiellia bacterium]